MAEGFFRSKKGFTVVQNEITRDTHISLKAKGLYLVIQAYISMPDKKWTKEDFRNLTKEGKKAFDSAWKELKDFGYLKAVSYTHLDVYKRQAMCCQQGNPAVLWDGQSLVSIK